MKAWIVHDSAYGNGEKLAQTMAKILEKDMKVEISHIKNITPEKVVADSPDMIVVGAAVRKFVTGGASKKWIRNLHKELEKANKEIKFGATFLTHAMPINWISGKGKRLDNLLAKSPKVGKVYPEFITGRVAGMEGPFGENVLEEVEQHATEILKWIKK